MLQDIAKSIKSQVNNCALNQDIITELALAAFFADGHILLEGPTGIGKTTWARAFAGALGLPYGSTKLAENYVSEGFLHTYENVCENVHIPPQSGALFTSVFHAEFYETEYKKTQPQTYVNPQSWAHMHILDALDPDKHVLTESVGVTFSLPDPHYIIISCNDTRILPKALLDRVMMKLYVNYPGVAAEKQILQMHHENISHKPSPAPICTPEDITHAKQEVQAVAVDDTIFNYIVSITETTRRANAIQTGASPRASIALLQASKAYAAINGRDHVTIYDVQCLAIPVLRHRITLRPEAISEGIHADRIIESIIAGK